MSHVDAIRRFRELHRAGCFVLPNPWDIGSAVALQQLGYGALATTSAGFAFSCGRPDTVRALAVDEVLAHVRRIVAATPLPVNADFQAGYADECEGVAANVVACVETGVAGLSIEDATGDASAPLFAREAAIERVRAARAAIDSTGRGVVLTARCEAWLVGDRTPARTAVDRLVAFADAGADCLFAPGVRDPAMIGELVAAVAPKPLNVLLAGGELTVARLADLGVRRVSIGSGLMRVAFGAFLQAARELHAHGTFGASAGAATFAELNAMFARAGD